MKNLMDHILYQIFKITLNISLKEHERFRITFNIKAGYYFKLLTPQAMKLRGSAKSKITENENGENVPNLAITEVVLIYCNIVNNNYQRNSRVLYTFAPNKSFGKLLDISPKSFIFLKTEFNIFIF